MQKIELLGYNTRTNKDETVKAVVASTKTLNIFMSNLKANTGIIPDTTSVKKVDFYLDKEQAKEIAKQISQLCLNEQNAMFIEHVLNVLKNGCIVKREKGEKPAVID